jgi:periplasmic protein CpxP/Spy
MVKHALLALVVAGLLYTVSPAVAQDNGSADQQSAPAGAPEHGHHHFDPAKRTEMLTKQLKLNSDQQAKVLDILKGEQSQMESLRSDTSASQDDRHSKMMEIHKTSNDQIRALLDPNQQKKWDTMQSQHEQWQGHHQEGQAPNGGASAPQQ